MRGCAASASAAVFQPGSDPRGTDPRSPNPLTGLTFFVDPTEPAWLKWRRYKRTSASHSAGLMWRIAGQPRFRWFGRWTRPRMPRKVREYLRCVQATQPGSVPLLTVMRHQGKKCGGGYDGGGAREDRRTRKWYRAFARAVGDARVVIAFEPDSLGTIDCLRRSRRKARMKLLAYGVKVLSRLPVSVVGLGRRPTTETGRRKVDAYLWVGRPGYSAGSCNGGPRRVGDFWPERALMFARYATGWIRPRG